MAFINHNGSCVDAQTPLFTAGNRAFCYGDAIFETIRVSGRKLLYTEDHLRRLKRGMESLQLRLRKELTPESLHAIAEELMNRNGITSGGRLRLEVYRNEGGFYTPATGEASFVITLEPLEAAQYVLNEKGLAIDVYTDVLRTWDKLSGLKTTNKLSSVMAGLYARERGLDECLLLNAGHTIAEAISSNLFIIKNGQFYTPSADQGCVEGIMRGNLLRWLRLNGKKAYECMLSPADLLDADEIFLTNVIQGVRWVGAYRQKRYFNTTSRWLTSLINTASGEQEQ